MSEQQPPDLDASGKPVAAQPPDLDAHGNPIGATAATHQPKGWMQSAVDFVKTHPTEIGATVGGIAAVPLTGGASLLPAMAAAGLGGAGGAGLGMMAGAVGGSPNIPATSTGVLRTMGEQGATQAAAEGGGRLIGSALKAGASRLYQSALAPTVALRNEFPSLIKTGLDNAVPVTNGGLAKAGTLKIASMDAANKLVSDTAAAPNAPTIDPRMAVGGITKAVNTVRDLPVARPQMRAIGDYGRQYLAEHPGPITLPDAQQAIRATDRFYDPAYRATMDRGNPITSGQTAAALGINDATRGLLRNAVPGLQEQNASTSALAGLEQGLERRTGNLANAMPFGMRHAINAGIGTATGAMTDKRTGAGTFLALEALNNPAIASHVAIAAARAGGGQISASLYPQLLRAAILARLSGETDTGSGPQ